MWFKKFSFKDDPYVGRDPFTIPLELIQWNRDDLQQRWNLEQFLDNVVQGYRVGLKAYGPAGSGKTWLMRYLEKVLTDKLGPDVAVIYGKIFKGDANFPALYDTLLRSWSKYQERILAAIAEEAGDTDDKWSDYIGDRDLAACLWFLKYKGNKEQVRFCENWLRGVRVSASNLAEVNITSSLDKDYRKYFVLRKLFELSSASFKTTLLIVDELENATTTFARGLGDFMRDMLDSFYEKFALACSYTTRAAADVLLDWGYGEFLFRRLEWEVKLDPVISEHAPAIFRVHHSAYREERFKGDQLLPFTEDGLRKIIQIMEPEQWYPGFILVNCGVLGRIASEAGVEQIDANFVDTETSTEGKRGRFPYLSPAPRLM